MSSSIDSSSRGVSCDKKRKREKDRKHKESRSRSRSHNRKRDKSRKRSKDKVREKQKENKYRRKSRSSSRSRKRKRNRSKSHNSYRSRDNSIELRSRSPSRDKKKEREEKLKKERREKKYDNEVDKLKDKEIEKMKEFEKKMQNQTSENNISININVNNLNKNIGSGAANIKNNLEKQMTEDEKREMLKKQRLAKARVFVLVERDEEKKNEEMLIENKGLIQDDFLEENNTESNKDKYRFEDDKHFDENENVYENQNHTNINNDYDINGSYNNIQNENDLNLNKQYNINQIDIDSYQDNIIDDEAQKINVSLGHRNMPHLPNVFFGSNRTSAIDNTNKEKIIKSKKIDISLGGSKSPINQINKCEKSNLIETKNDEEEDPLDAYMKTIEKDATLQDYQIYQELLNQQFQQKYDEAVARDSRSEASKANKKQVFNPSDNDIDDVKVIEDNREMEIDQSKVITLEDILKLNEQNGLEEEKITSGECNQIALFYRGEDDLDKKFIETLKKANVPDYDPLYGYSNTNHKQDVVLYKEDYNEYLKEDSFNGFAEEEAWLKLKKSTTEKKELKLVNHSFIKYEEYRKNLYVESKEISNLKDEDVEKIRAENGDIKVRGKNIPRPIQNWFQCGLSDRILKVLEKKKFSKPFPIQAQAVPCIMSGRDVIGIAETGSGKTLAFVLPMLRHVLDQRPIKVNIL